MSPAFRTPGDEIVERRKPGRRGELGLGVLRSEYVEQAAHLAERLAAALLGGAEMPGETIRPSARRKLSEGRDDLDDRDAQVMRHDVVQLAGDPCSLLRDCAPRLLLLLLLEPGGTAPETDRLEQLPTPQPAQQERDGKRKPDARDALDIVPTQHLGELEAADRPCNGAGAEQPPAFVGVSGDRVERNEKSDPRLERCTVVVREADRPDEDRDGDDHGDRDRRGRTPGQRDGCGEEDQRRGRTRD